MKKFKHGGSVEVNGRKITPEDLNKMTAKEIESLGLKDLVIDTKKTTKPK